MTSSTSRARSFLLSHDDEGKEKNPRVEELNLRVDSSPPRHPIRAEYTSDVTRQLSLQVYIHLREPDRRKETGLSEEAFEHETPFSIYTVRARRHSADLN